MGILRSSTLWATDLAYLNDTSEFQYAQTMISEAVGALQPNPLVAEAIGIVKAHAKELGLEMYASCFCEEDDLLSQWRAYSGNDTGYCIQFDWAMLGKCLVPRSEVQGRVVYLEDQQRDLVRRLIIDPLRSDTATLNNILEPLDLLQNLPFS